MSKDKNTLELGASMRIVEMHSRAERLLIGADQHELVDQMYAEMDAVSSELTSVEPTTNDSALDLLDCAHQALDTLSKAPGMTDAERNELTFFMRWLRTMIGRRNAVITENPLGWDSVEGGPSND